MSRIGIGKEKGHDHRIRLFHFQRRVPIASDRPRTRRLNPPDLNRTDWKRLIAADGPRQSINALTLYSFAYANGFQTSNLPAYWDNSIMTLLLLLAMIATVLIWAISMFLLVAAAVCYIPLLCYIQGNLKVSRQGVDGQD